VPTAGLIDSVTAPRLLDREPELTAAAERLSDAHAGAGGATMLEGPGGIGKTALLQVICEDARTRGFTVLAARATQLERAFAFGVARQLLEAPATGAEADALLAGAAGLSRPVFDLSGVEADEHSLSVLHGLYWLCANLAARAPLLIVVDDAHWADVASLELLVYLTRRATGLPLAVVIATRPAAPADQQRLLDALRDDPLTTLVRPRALDVDAIAHLVGDCDAEMLEAVRHATGGNPFLLHELVRELPLGAAQVRDLGPRPVARRVLSRLVDHTAETVAVARAVAVLGSDAETRHVGRLARIEPARAVAALDALDADAITTGSRPAAFRHPIVRSAIYADIPAGERARLHATAARLLADAAVPAERVAGHLLAAEPTGDTGTVEQLAAVARAALARGAPASAVTYLERALAEPPSPARRLELLAQLGRARSLLGDPRAVEALREVIAGARDPAMQAAAARALARFLVLSGEPGQAASIYSATSGRRQLELEAAAVGAALGDANAAGGIGDRLSALRVHAAAEGAPSPDVLAALAITDALAGVPAEGVAVLARRALASGDPVDAGWLARLVPLVSALLFAEAYDDVDAAVEKALSFARERGWVAYAGLVFGIRSCVALRRGALADAEADARAALETAPPTGFFGLFAAASLVEALVERDRAVQAEEELARLALPDHAGAVTYAAVLHARGRMHLALRRPADALDDFHAAGEQLMRCLSPSPSPGAWRSGAALALHALGRGREARDAVAEEVALATRLAAPRALGIALRRAGLVEGDIARLEAAVEVLERSQAPLELAWALADLGAALRRAGRRAEAREPLRRALDLAHRCGADAAAAQAKTELLATGARPRRASLSGPAALTASERRVAEMAAEGMSNRDIAQALFVTQRTVETHLTHTFQKLRIDSRAALGAALAQ
jgi:DNA-binding CsgD family transcriptional regulator